MQQSAKVKQVLESKEFQAWMPHEPVEIELKASTNLTIGFLFAAGISGFYMLAFRSASRDFNGWLPTLLLLLCGLFVTYLFVFGFGESRSIRYNNEFIEVSAGGKRLLRSPWSEIVAVRPNWITGFEIQTRSGRVSVWWWVLVFWEDGYSKFFYHVLKALAKGYDKSKLNFYRPPVYFVDGANYTYSIPPNVEGTFMVILAIVSFILSVVIPLVTPPKPGPNFSVIGISFGIGSAWRFIQTYSPRKYHDGDKVMIANGTITVLTEKGNRRASYRRLEGTLLPTFKPKPFANAELYGDPDNSIIIDRRYLVKVGI